jgi:predicted CopG family antitoxin
MPSATIRLTDEESRLIKSYAAQERRSVSDVIRLAILDQIEDEYDLALFERAKKEFESDPVTYSLDEIKTRHGLR